MQAGDVLTLYAEYVRLSIASKSFMMDRMGEDQRQLKRERILDAALAKFSAYGFTRTSMNDIAEAASMSRPALYQHYGNKEEVFHAMLSRLLNDAADQALAALTTEPTLEAQLDGFLQRWFGDLTQQVRRTEHGDELMEAKASYAKPVFDTVNKRVAETVAAHFEAVNPDRAGSLTDLLLLSPLGLKYDSPPMSTLRTRFSELAASLAATALADDT
jgi:AcrR family transcriptional regulator